MLWMLWTKSHLKGNVKSDERKFNKASQKRVKFKMCELFVSRDFHFIFSHHTCLSAAKTMGIEHLHKGRLTE